MKTILRQSWSVADDWSSLSDESPQNAIPDSSDLFNVDLTTKAASRMIESTSSPSLSNEDILTNDVVSEIYTSYSSDDPPLYDTGFEPFTQNIEDEMGKEIALLIRCNERPEQLLIAEGRAFAPLTEEEKNDPMQLVALSSEGVESTDFFKHAVSNMFHEHALHGSNVNLERETSLDAAGVARWMTKSLGTETFIGKHDRRVLAVISRHGSYGSGRLTEGNFQELYLSAVVGEMPRRAQTMDQLKYRQLFINDVWRDLRNHGFVSPIEKERELLEAEIRTRLGAGTAAESKDNAEHLGQVMDECEILEWDDRFEASVSGNKEGKSVDWRRSSHELVELAKDGKTPLWLRDGDFVFIDEESCIGCTQCASASPSSFLMLENGRARTFSQRSAADVDQAVASCPVNCMHRVSFRELKGLEVVRDHGDGRTDHRHMGRGQGHTPLSVAGVGGDASHKDSWYHYMRNKCFMSKQCPQRGCFDCPYYSVPGQNPQWKQLHKEAEHIRAQEFTERGIADSFRKAVDL